MKIVLIGAGNLATHLGKALHAAGHDMLQVFSRTMQSAETLASLLDAEPLTDIAQVRDDADVYIFSVKDSALPQLVAQLCRHEADGLDEDGAENALREGGAGDALREDRAGDALRNAKHERVFLHTAGSMPMSVFKGMAQHYGVLYPMQTFSKQREVDFSIIPCFVEANDEFAQKQIESLAREISGRVYQLSSEDRKYLHLSAVFACNFANHCYAISQELLEEHGIPFDVMLPLINETAAKVHEMKPKDAQTGPAVRYDENVIDKQSKLLENHPHFKKVYDSMSKSIHGLNAEN